MKKSVSMICAILTTFIWGTTFVAQTTGMDMIGPLTFNGSRFFIGFLTLIPVALIFEKPSSDRSFIKEAIFSFKLRFVRKGPNQYMALGSSVSILAHQAKPNLFPKFLINFIDL